MKVISLGCLHSSLSDFEGKHTLSQEKTHIDSINRWLSAFVVYCTVLLTSFPHRAGEMFAYQEIIRLAHGKLTGFAWLSYDIDFLRKAAGNLALNWGERNIQLYLLKFTGQVKASCSVCGNGDHFSHSCSLPAVRPTSTWEGVCHNFNHGTKHSQDSCPLSHCRKICDEDHPSYQRDASQGKARSQADKKSSNCWSFTVL